MVTDDVRLTEAEVAELGRLLTQLMRASRDSGFAIARVSACIREFVESILRERPAAPESSLSAQTFEETPEARLRRLPPNWDTYGGAPPAEAALQAARCWLDCIAWVPCSDGGVQLEWRQQGREHEIKFMPDGTVETQSGADHA